jgi:hypothetical protein
MPRSRRAHGVHIPAIHWSHSTSSRLPRGGANDTVKLFAVICLCVFGSGCDVRVNTGRATQKADDAAMAENTKTHVYGVQWGYRGDDLAYVSIVGQRVPAGTVTGIVSGTVSGSRRDYYVHRPDGSKIPVPGRIQLFELIDGRYSESTQRVSLAEFTAFRESRPDEYSIAALVRFAEDRRHAK